MILLLVAGLLLVGKKPAPRGAVTTFVPPGGATAGAAAPGGAVASAVPGATSKDAWVGTVGSLGDAAATLAGFTGPMGIVAGQASKVAAQLGVAITGKKEGALAGLSPGVGLAGAVGYKVGDVVANALGMSGNAATATKAAATVGVGVGIVGGAAAGVGLAMAAAPLALVAKIPGVKNVVTTVAKAPVEAAKSIVKGVGSAVKKLKFW